MKNELKEALHCKSWTAIGVTASTPEQAKEFVKELQTRQLNGLIARDTLLMAIPDPNTSGIYESSHPAQRSHQPVISNVGSGTSTINALFVISERLSVMAGRTYIDGELLRTSRILLLHIGGLNHHMPQVNLCTKAFTIIPLADSGLRLAEEPVQSPSEPFESDNPVYPIDLLLSNLNVIVGHIDAGLMIASTESLILLDKENPSLDNPEQWRQPGVSIVTVPVGEDMYTQHGVCRVDADGQICDIAYKKSHDYLSKNGYLQDSLALVYTSLVLLCPKTTEKLLYLHSTPPLDSCTYLGVDNGAVLLKFGILPDILLAMAKDQTLESYLEIPPVTGNTKYVMDKARRVLWKTFHGTPIRSITLKGKYFYLKHSRDFLNFINVQKEVKISRCIHSFIDNKEPIQATVVNSILHGDGYAGAGSIIYSSSMSGNWRIGSNSIVLGVHEFSFGFHLADNMAISEVKLRPVLRSLATSDDAAASNGPSTNKVLVLVGIDDDLDCHMNDPSATIANRPWNEFFTTSGVTPDEVWPAHYPRILRTARLFPVLTGDPDQLLDSALWLQDATAPSLSVIGRWRSSKRMSIADITGESSRYSLDKHRHGRDAATEAKIASTKTVGDIAAAFQWRRELSFQIDALKVERIIAAGQDICVLPYFQKWANMGTLPLPKILAALDRIAISAPIQHMGRMLSAISDFMALYARGSGGLRSGPARNASWDPALQCFVRKDERKGVIAMAKEREHWLSSADSIVRAARHYEGAGQIVIKNIVDTCRTTLLHSEAGPTPLDTWVRVAIPARIDLAGGWTDTPPICYEHGGRVINVAIKVDGRKPIEVRARRTTSPTIVFHVESMDSDAVICTEFSDLADYSRPMAPAALLKACFLLLGVVDTVTRPVIPLATQLTEIGGLEITSTSALPTGSGLGTSSILASALLAAMAHVYGRRYEEPDLVHAVLKVEQMLTTGGGWQDQIGGIVGGFKEAHCTKFKGKSDSIDVIFSSIPVSPEATKTLNEHLLLIYTGRTRLARDLLQDVIRRWYSKTEEILQVTDQLVTTTHAMRKALESGDLVGIGKFLRTYWEQKKCMASGAEPNRIKELAAAISHLVHGYSLVGAGGGGFMVAITKDINTVAIEKMKELFTDRDEFASCTFHMAEIDMDGMQLTMDQ
eukprot:gene8962-10510_t